MEPSGGSPTPRDGGHGALAEPAQRRRRISVAAVAAFALLGGALMQTPVAQAATRPSVVTGAAQQVGYASATLTGTVNPNGSDASYYFQYGPTAAYGGQTAIADAGAGTKKLVISLSVAGLQPLTLYHFRLVAVNAAGVSFGADKTLLSTKVPLSLQIFAAPSPVLYGGPLTVQGTLSGTGNGEREVVLQADTFPFSAGFQDLGNPELTTAAGSFSFPVLSLLAGTAFRVVTTTSPPVVSPVWDESVVVKVVAHIGRTRRAHFARIYGQVTPAENGMQVGILRTVHGKGVLAGGTVLRPLGAGSSSFSRVLHVVPGVYRVLVRVSSGALSSNYSQPLVVR